MTALSTINVLPKEVYQLIAAGEVVERPASVVKETVENSIDAGAKNITVEIKNGGSTYIRITDDGCGIARSEIKKVFISHATSKISCGADLDKIGTLGFRGEAMASISAVAKVQLLTRSEDEEVGTCYEIAGSQEVSLKDAGCPVGTTIVITDIFFNTPARMKFLKKDVTEGNAVSSVIEKIALSHPEISFRFIRDGKQTIVTSGNGDLKDTIYSVLGREFTKSLIPVDYSINNMRVSGFVTKPAESRKSRAMQYFFINSRFVKSQTCMAALEQAYRNSIMVGKFPGCVLNVECNNSFVDVNVHPAKIEVRFVNEKPVFELVYYGVKTAIQNGDTPVQAEFKPKYEQYRQTTVSGKIDFFKPSEQAEQIKFKQQNPDNFWRASAPNKNPIIDINPEDEEVSKENYKINIGEFKAKFNNGNSVVREVEIPPVIVSQEQEKQPDENFETQETVEETVYEKEEKNIIDVPDFRLVGEVFKTYIIIEIENSIYMIDKHAAHERMNFEELKAASQVVSQVLLSPVSVRLSGDEYNAVINNLKLYEKCGFVIEDFGNSTVLVRECPSILDGEDVGGLIEETAQKLLDGKTDITPDKMDWIFHSASCRAAVKAGDNTTKEEMELFVKKLLSNPDIRYCPHGRPVMIKLSKYDIEKQFGRIQ